MPRSRWLFVLVLLLPGCAGVGPYLFDARLTACLPDFANQGGWYGGDIASSIPLDDTPGRVRLWLFGDSELNCGSHLELLCKRKHLIILIRRF